MEARATGSWAARGRARALPWYLLRPHHVVDRRRPWPAHHGPRRDRHTHCTRGRGAAARELESRSFQGEPGERRGCWCWHQLVCKSETRPPHTSLNFLEMLRSREPLLCTAHKERARGAHNARGVPLPHGRPPCGGPGRPAAARVPEQHGATRGAHMSIAPPTACVRRAWGIILCSRYRYPKQEREHDCNSRLFHACTWLERLA